MPQPEAVFAYYLQFGTAAALLGLLVFCVWFRLWKRGAFSAQVLPGVSGAVVWLPFLYAAVVAGFMLDSWWHVAIGRDSFWIPPHMMILAAMSLIFLIAARQVPGLPRAHRGTLLAVLLFSGAFLLGLAFDDTAHRLYGQENLSTALVFLAPPHVFMSVMAISLGFAIVSLVKLVPERLLSETDRQLSALLTLGATFAGVEYFLFPFWPFIGYHVMGMYGSLVTLGALAFVLSLATRHLPSPAKFPGFFVTLTATAVMLLRSKNFINPDVPLFGNVLPVPVWLVPVSLLAGALLFDLALRRRSNPLLPGFLYGLGHALVFYVLGAAWFSFRGFEAVAPGLWIAFPVLLSALGGALGGRFAFWLKARFGQG